MAEMLYLVDSNILIRWVQPADADYQVVEGALASLVKSGAVLCYTPQNVAEFWNASTRPSNAEWLWDVPDGNRPARKTI